MNDLWLRSFIQSADKGSFTKAAESSFISTAALVQQINLMEKELGFLVFERSKKGIKLTPAGEEFYNSTKHILECYDKAVKRGCEMQHQYNVVIKIAYQPNEFPNKWLKSIASYKKENVGVDIIMYPVRFSNQIQVINRGLADMCIIAEPREELLTDSEHYKIFDDVCAFCMRGDNKLASKKCITLNDLKNETITYAKYSYMKSKFEDTLKQHCKELYLVSEEYDLSIKLKAYSDNAIFVVHSAWGDSYGDIHKVVKSDIPAGGVDVVYRKEKEKEVNRIIDYLKEQDCFSI